MMKITVFIDFPCLFLRSQPLDSESAANSGHSVKTDKTVNNQDAGQSEMSVLTKTVFY